jgi:uncharacterized protein (DUF983 family)
MNNDAPSRKSSGIRLSSVIRARCPSCHTGRVLQGVFAIRPRCPHCDYDFHPEPGFYMGAMVVGFLLTAMVTVPPMVALKLLNVDMNILLAFPFVEFLFVGTFLMFYCRILWLHLEHRMTKRLDGNNEKEFQ